MKFLAHYCELSAQSTDRHKGPQGTSNDSGAMCSLAMETLYWSHEVIYSIYYIDQLFLQCLLAHLP